MVIPSAPWTRALEDGTVQIPGVSWECVSNIALTPARFIATKQSDVGENGVRRLALDVIRGAPSVGIPVFFGRELMQRNIIVRDDSTLVHPADLVGKRVGSWLSPVSGTSVGVLLMLEKGCGVPLKEIHWHIGEPSQLPKDRMGLKLNPGPRTDTESFERLQNGDLDAVVITGGPRYFSMFGMDKIDRTIAPYPRLRPLVNDPETMAEAYRRTGLYLITDTAVVTTGLVEGHPDILPELVKAFSAANDLAPRYRSEKEEEFARREIELLRENPHKYGLGENQRRNLTALLDFLFRLGALERPVEPEELFATPVRQIGNV